jgi:hypothetical protein
MLGEIAISHVYRWFPTTSQKNPVNNKIGIFEGTDGFQYQVFNH